MRVDRRDTIGPPGHMHELTWNGRKLVCRTCTVLDEPQPRWQVWLEMGIFLTTIGGGLVVLAALYVWGSR